MKVIEGGVCAAKGFRANGVHCGIRKNHSKKDLSLIFSTVPASAAAVYTTNLVKGAPLTVTKKHIANGTAQAVICNSGNANTCNANGIEIAEEMSALAASALGIAAEDVVVASTGVIGQPLSIDPIAAGLPELVAGLSDNGSGTAAEGIMTTDTVRKEVAVEFTLGGKTCRLGGIAKGSGMIHPNMATMLVFLTTDAAISPAMLQKALSGDIANTFNMLSIDGDTSTNDMVTILANGLAGNPEVKEEGEDFTAFMQALNSVTIALCRKIAGDGEGATKLLECKVTGQDRCQERHLLQPAESRHVRCGRQLGSGAVRHRLQRRGRGRAQGGRGLLQPGGHGGRLQGRRGSGFFRGNRKAGASGKGNRNPGGAEQRRRRLHRLGLRSDLRLCQNQRRLSHLRKMPWRICFPIGNGRRF